MRTGYVPRGTGKLTGGKKATTKGRATAARRSPVQKGAMITRRRPTRMK